LPPPDTAFLKVHRGASDEPRTSFWRSGRGRVSASASFESTTAVLAEVMALLQHAPPGYRRVIEAAAAHLADQSVREDASKAKLLVDLRDELRRLAARQGH